MHLNPVWLSRLGLNKSQQKASRADPVSWPDPEVVSERLRTLREYRWTSYFGYAGYGAPLAWVFSEPLSRLCGGRTEAERRAPLRQYTEQPVRQGAVECPWGRLVAGLVLGTETFARSLKPGLRAKEREQRQARNLARPVAWEEIILALEQALGEKWADFSGRYGDWGRDAALWFGRRQGRLSLARLGELAGEMDYAAVSVAVRRFGQRLAGDRNMRHQVDKIEQTLLNVES